MLDYAQEKREITEKVINLLNKYSDENGRVECRRALAISNKLKIPPIYVGRIATENGYRISQCELGQFGNKKIDGFYSEVYNFLKEFSNEEGKITCENAYKVARRFGLYKVRSTIKNSDLDVINCQLGCFTQKRKARLKIFVSLDIKSKNTGKTITNDQLRLLNIIKSSSNLCEAISKAHITFTELKEKLTLLEASLGIKCLKGNYSCEDKPLLTDEALTWLKKLEKLQDEVEVFAVKRFKELFYGDRIYRK